MTQITEPIGDLTAFIARTLGTHQFIVHGTLAIVLVSLICGAVGALIVSNRMAFFSDALAHCSFAGVALGIILTLLIGGQRSDDALDWLLKFVMIAFGIGVGVAIAYVLEKTNLASDTVIGVFFAAAIGFGALLFGALKFITTKNAEQFLFGSAIFVSEFDLLLLALLALVTAIAMARRYNQLVFTSFNASLARSRNIPTRLHNYLFIVLLAIIVNVCLQAVGILLINAMLIVPAATAINVSRNLRQMFWWTLALSLACGLSGMWLSTQSIPVRGVRIPLGTGGCIVMLSVLAFAASMFLGPWLKRRSLSPALPASAEQAGPGARNQS